MALLLFTLFSVRIDIPCLVYSLGGSIITYISQHKLTTAKKLLAVGDHNGSIRILSIPHCFADFDTKETKKLEHFVRKELSRKSNQINWVNSYYEENREYFTAKAKAEEDAKANYEQMLEEKKDRDAFLKRKAVEEEKN